MLGMGTATLFAVLAQVKVPGANGTTPDPTASVQTALNNLTNLDDACGTNPSWTCRTVYDFASEHGWSDPATWAGAAEWFVAKPLTILLIALLAILATRIARKVIRRGMRRMFDPEHQRARKVLRRATPLVLQNTAEHSLRSEARMHTLTTVFQSLASVAIWFIAVIWMLQIVHIDLAPFVFSAGVVGVALGFGAQNIVRDFLAGTFIVIEDQIGVGDIVDLGGDAKGTVEQVTLRATRGRDVQGTLWHVPNGQILRVANKSQEWARALLDVEVDRSVDYEVAAEVIRRVAEELSAEPDWMAEILSAPEVWGIESFTEKGYAIRLVIKTRPASQFGVMRELRIRLLAALTEAHITAPGGGRPELWVHDGDAADARAAATSAQEDDPQPQATDQPQVQATDEPTAAASTPEEPAPHSPPRPSAAPPDHPPRGDPTGAG